MSERGLFYDIRRRIQVLLYDLTTPEFMSKLYFRYYLGYSLNLKNPQTFNEKNQWLKLYEWPNNKLAIQCGDKYTVRSYLQSQGMGEYLNDLLFVCDSVDEINWDQLPDQFAIKVSAGCGYNIICDDKSKLNMKKVKKTLNRWLREDFANYNAEPHYSKMHSKIICERFLSGNMIDYKFYCYHGKCAFAILAQGEGKQRKFGFYDTEGKLMPFQKDDFELLSIDTMPCTYQKMIELSERLSKPFIGVRVDWYEVDNKLYFGELTFTPNGCLTRFSPREYDLRLGDLINLPNNQ